MTVPRSESRPPRWGFSLTIFLLALAPRLALALFAVTAGGDWSNSYHPLAENILLHGCISLSPPETAACLPSWGGNQLPGFSAFVAAVWLFAGPSWPAVAIVQGILVSAAIVAVAHAAAALSGDRRAGWAVGVVLALSPQHLAWVRFLSTDALTVAVTLAIIATLLGALHRGRLPVVALAVAMIGALALRLDLFLLAIPVAVAGFLLHTPAEALRRGLLIGVLILVPAGLWTARNIAVGLPPAPTHFFSPKFALPSGYVGWGYSWTTIEYQYAGWYNPAVSGHYDRIRIDPAIYVNADEQREVEDLLARLRPRAGEPIPADIDAAFARLAEVRAADYPMRHGLVYPALRAVNMWFNPRNSTAWPVDLDAASVAAADGSGLAGLMRLALAHPVSAAVKAASGAHRLALLALTAWLLVYSCSRRAGGRWRVVLWAACAYALVRTLFFAYFPLVETRYIMPVTPWLEVAVVLGLLARFWPQLAPGLVAVRRPSPDS